MDTTAIVDARIFDGEEVIPATSVVIEGTRILSIGGAVPDHAVVVDARGGTLMPGLIDAHVHTSLEALELALTFGVTTELEMQGMFTRDRRARIDEDDRVFKALADPTRRFLLDRLFTRAYLTGESDAFLAGLSPADAASLQVVREAAGDLRFDLHLQGDRETVFLSYPRHRS